MCYKSYAKPHYQRCLLIFLQYCKRLLDLHHSFHGLLGDQAGKPQTRFSPRSFQLRYLVIPWVTSTQQKGRTVDGQEAGSRQAVSPAAIPTESSSLSARSVGSSPAKDRLVSSSRLQMPALWLPALPYFHFCRAQGGLLSALFDHKRQRFKEVSEEQKSNCHIFFSLSPTFFSGTRNQTEAKVINRHLSWALQDPNKQKTNQTYKQTTKKRKKKKKAARKHKRQWKRAFAQGTQSPEFNPSTRKKQKPLSIQRSCIQNPDVYQSLPHDLKQVI